MKLGYIDYLNCYPFYYHMFEHKPLEGIEVLHRYPSILNSMMVKGELPMSAISAATYSQLNGKALLLPDFCLSSIGYVGSVVLRSNLPIEELDRKKVGLTSASHTSVLLLKMLMKSYYNTEPDYVKTEPNPSMEGLDAVLMIGNEAMVESGMPVSFSYDLGELWLRKTGFPVVFAVFAVREEALEKYDKEINRVIKSYYESIECLERESDKVIESAQKKYPEITYDIQGYFRTLQFKFTDRLKMALEFYYDKAFEMGLFEEKVKVKYLE
ncbi:menaquinone biosynthetic enzyme MqnA/MqnD family protein [Thermodesulfobacteriota bacterium]